MNHFTHFLALTIDNDREQYEFVMKLTGVLAEDTHCLALKLKEYFAEVFCYDFKDNFKSKLVNDLLGEVKEQIEWYSLAQHYLDKLQEIKNA